MCPVWSLITFNVPLVIINGNKTFKKKNICFFSEFMLPPWCQDFLLVISWCQDKEVNLHRRGRTKEVMTVPGSQLWVTFGDVELKAVRSIEHRLSDLELESLLSTVRLSGCSRCSRNIVSIDFYRNKRAKKKMMTHLSSHRCLKDKSQIPPPIVID